MSKESILAIRDSMVFYRSFYESIKELPYENQLEVYNAIFELSLNFGEIELSGLSKTIFRLIKPQIEANNKKFIDGCKGAEHGKKGGRPPREKTPQKPHKNPIGDFENNPIKTPNVNDNVNDNVNVYTLNTISNIDANSEQNSEEKISPLTKMRRESLEIWKKIASEYQMKFTKSEWEEIYGYIIAKPSLQPHEITTTLRSIYQWANDGLDIKESLRAGQRFKSLVRPKTVIMHDRNNQRIYGKGLTEHRNRIIEAEELEARGLNI
jgi:hypothetical protein